jgi:hypothetical protein
LALKELKLAIETEGRDQGKAFHITEWPAIRADRWANRAILAVLRSNPYVPAELQGAGMAGLLGFGMKALFRTDADAMQPLLDEMLGCVKIIPDPAHPKIIRDLVESDNRGGLYAVAIEKRGL